jgi:acyl-CoA thioester hydrolase
MNFEDVFSIDIDVRNYELDTQGHVNSTVYLMYAEHARWRHLESLGIYTVLRERGISPVFLELTVKYHRELRAGDTVRVTSAFVDPGGASKILFGEQQMIKPDNTLVAELRSKGGLLDLKTRRLIACPRQVLTDLIDSMALTG